MACQNLRKNQKKISGNFSLILALLVGIFYPHNLFAVQTVRYDQPSNPIYTATFSYDLAGSPFRPRAHIVPDRVYFNASGTSEASMVPKTYTAPYPAWATNYTTGNWTQVINNLNLFPNFYDLSMNVAQQKPGSSMSTPAGTLFVSRMNLDATRGIILDAYANESNFLQTPLALYPKDVSTGTNISRPHAMVVSSSRAYFFWLNSSNNLQMRTFDGTSFSAQIEFSDPAILNNFGVSGCLLTSGGNEYVAITYARSLTESAIVTFADGNFPSTATFTVNLGATDVDSFKIDIAQNPRSGVVYLNWLKNEKAYYRSYDFTGPSTFANPSANIEFSTDLERDFGLKVAGFDNFETGFALPKKPATTNNIQNMVLRSGLPTQVALLPPSGYSILFPYRSGSENYAGLLTLSSFNTFNLHRRQLHYPSDAAWDKSTKILHLQGPPQPGSLVGVEVDFAEVDKVNSIAHLANAAGNRGRIDGSTGVIASASTLYSVAFDKDMRQADFPTLIGSGKVRMLRPDDTTVPLSYDSGSARSFNFTTNLTDLLFNTTYRISIASDVVDANGSQIFEAATLTFTTQPTSSTVLASEVTSITTFSDAARLNEITAGSEINATSTIFLRVQAVNPAFNTFDTSTVSVWRNGTQIAVVNMIQEVAASNNFFGQYNVTAGQSENSTYEFRAVNPAISRQLLVNYPTFAPVSPASGAINIAPAATIIIEANEDISAAEIDATTVRLTLGGAPVAASRSYDGPSRRITITPSASMLSEQTYKVEISGLFDPKGNPQVEPLSYIFTIADVTPPTIVLPTSPTNGETGVTIDRHIKVNFSEAILAASANPATVKLSRSGTPASYSVTIIGSAMTIDPDDAPDNGLRPQTLYNLEIGPSVTDLAGNGLANAPATFSMSFTTQPLVTAPATIDSITLYKDSMLMNGWSVNERLPASTTIYFKVTGTDGATQTRDVATIAMDLSWVGGITKVPARETASNSSGLYVGSFDLDTLPLFGFPGPLPPTPLGSITFSVEQDMAKAATLTVSFPELKAAQTTVSTTAGSAAANGATNVLITSPVTLAFSDKLQNSGNATNLSISSGAVIINASRVLQAGDEIISLAPTASLPFSSVITVSGTYADNGLKSTAGNPIYQPFSFNFTTQASQTPLITASQLFLFPDASFNPLTAYAANADLPQAGTIYIEVRGADAAANTLDYTFVNISTGDSLRLNETAVNTGIYRGSYPYAALADGTNLVVTSTVTPAVNHQLTLTLPALSILQPASGAANVSISGKIEVKANEDLDPASINSTSIKLFNGAVEVPGTIVYRSADKEIEFTPAAALDYSSTYIFRATNLKDSIGNSQAATLAFSFSTQASSVPPAAITEIKVFANSDYTGELADLSLVPASSQVYVRILAPDASPTTADSTITQISSNQTALITNLNLIETALNSGIFTGTANIYPEENATLTFTSVTDGTKSTRLRTHIIPRVSSFNPASSTANLYRDTLFSIFTNKDVDAASISSATVTLTDVNGIASYQAFLHAPREIRVRSDMAANSNISLRVANGLKDSDGLNFAATTASFSSINPAFTQFRLYANPAMTSLIPDGGNVETGQTVFALLNGTNAYFYSVEKATATYFTSLSTADFSLSENTPGNFQGSFVVPDEANATLRIRPEGIAALENSVTILPAFALESFSPASGAMAVPADTWPTWNFTRKVRAADITTGNFSLVRVSDSFAVPGTLSVSPSGKQIRFQPAGILSLLTPYRMSLSGAIQDDSGNVLGTSIVATFTTQPPPAPPTSLISLKNFENPDYATPTIAVANNGNLYLELVAADTSFSTYESTKVRLDSSDGSIDGVELNLVEISPPSGIFRASLPINLPPGINIRIQSQANPAFFIDITSRIRTGLVSLAPASSSSGLQLDTPISLTFTQPIDRTTTSRGIKLNASAATDIGLLFSYSDGDRTIQITPQTAYATSTRHLLAVNTDLRDTNGLFILPFGAHYTTLSENVSLFDLLTGTGNLSGQSVRLNGEAVLGNVTIVASTTSLFLNYPEFRTAWLQTATQTFAVTMSESTPGSFAGNFVFTATMPTSINASLRFADLPAFNFSLAPAPLLTGIFPASGSINISELPLITASFSRRLALSSAANALKIVSNNSTARGVSPTLAADGKTINWNLDGPLPQQSSCTLELTGLTDYLGQTIASTSLTFSTGGRQGINLYLDSGFVQLIASNEIQVPVVYVEVSASGSENLASNTFNLSARRGTQATTTLSLLLEPISGQSGRFRCSLELAPTRAPPNYSLPLVPGEWLELFAPALTSDRKLFYYLYSGSVSPTNILGIDFYSEKHFAQKAGEFLHNPSLYIDMKAEDLNWLTTDTTRAKVFSEADPRGFIIELSENGTHSDSFRGMISIAADRTDAARNTLKVLPSQRITVESLTDPSIREFITYLPENGIRMISVYPSPARGSRINFRFYLNFPTDVDLEIFDTAGHEVFATVVRGLEGENVFDWRLPGHLANGVYFYRFQIGNDTSFPTATRRARGKFAVLR